MRERRQKNWERAVQRKKRKKENNAQIFEESVDSRMIERGCSQSNVSRVSGSMVFPIDRAARSQRSRRWNSEKLASSERSDE